MKTLLKITLLLFVLNAFQSCSNDDAPTPEPIAQPEPDPIPEPDPEPEPDPIVPAVTSMSPLSGPKTTIVKFTGTDFGVDASTVQVFFDDIAAEVQNVTETEITTVVPPRAFFGEAKLVINGTEITGFTFEYEIVDVQVSTVAGGESGFVDGNVENARFTNLSGITVDASGNIYVSDLSSSRIRKITMENMVSTLAGNGENGNSDGVSANASFSLPIGLETDSFGNIYIADSGNHKIRKITPSGVVSTFAGSTQGFADGASNVAQFSSPFGIAIDSDDNVYVADFGNHKIRKISSNGEVTTVAGSTFGYVDGVNDEAQFFGPWGIALDGIGNLYVADQANHKIRKIDVDGNVSTVAGSTQGFQDGMGENTQFNSPTDVTVDPLGNIYVTDNGNYRIRKINVNREVATLAGAIQGFEDGNGVNAQFDSPVSIVIDKSFTLYIAENNNNSIRKITQE